MDKFNGVINEVFTQVIALFGRLGRIYPVVVVNQIGRELIGFAVQKPVVAVEAALQGPLIKRSGRRGVLH